MSYIINKNRRSRYKRNFNNKSNELYELLERQKVNELSRNYNILLSNLANTVKNETLSRNEYYFELMRLRDNFITNGIYDIVMNDVFLDTGSDNYAYIEVVGNEKLTKELNTLFEEKNIFTLIYEIFPDLLHYGCHALVPIVKPGIGLVSLLDIYDSYDVVAITDLNNIPLFYFIQKNPYYGKGDNRYYRNNYTEQSVDYNYEFKGVNDLVYFSIGLEYTKVTLDEKSIKKIRSSLPVEIQEKFAYGFKIKIPKSFISGSMDKIKETVLMDQIRVYKSIGELLSPTVIGIPVPDVYDPKTLATIRDRYDEIINGRLQRLGNINNPQFTIPDIASTAVIPISGEKAIPQVLDTGKESRVIPVTSVEDSLSQTLNTLGIPLDLFLGNQDTSPKDNIRKNSRYSKKIKRIQKHIGNSIKIICLLHLSNKYEDLNIGINDINVVLKNNNNADELYNLEPQDLLISSFNNLMTVMQTAKEFTSDSDYKIDTNSVMESLKSQLERVGSPYSKAIIKEANNKL